MKDPKQDFQETEKNNENHILIVKNNNIVQNNLGKRISIIILIFI